MKDSLKKFYDYYDSEEELMYFVRMHAAWNEDSFRKMQQLAREVMKDYADAKEYPKGFVLYFMREIPSVINMISHFRACTEEERQAGYTEESYLAMIAQRIRELKELHQEFMSSLATR